MFFKYNNVLYVILCSCQAVLVKYFRFALHKYLNPFMAKSAESAR